MESNIIWLVPLLPIAGFLFQIFIGRKLPKVVVGPISCFLVFISAILAWKLFFDVRALDETVRHLGMFGKLTNWIAVPGIGEENALNILIEHKLVVDPLSSVMILVVTNIGFLIHL